MTLSSKPRHWARKRRFVCCRRSATVPTLSPFLCTRLRAMIRCWFRVKEISDVTTQRRSELD